MSSLAINFAVAQSPWRWPQKGSSVLLISLVLTVATVTWGAWWLWQQYQELTEAKAQLAQEKFKLPSLPPVVTSAQKHSYSAADVEVINTAIRRLNTPWPAIFSGFESVSSSEVALLAIAPDSQVSMLRGTAEVRSHEAMIDYVQRLSEVAPFTQAVLVKHETNDRDPQRPLQFSFEVWLQPPKKGAP